MRLILLVVTMIISSFVAGCNSDADRTKQAILRVMRADEQLMKKCKTMPPNSVPSQIALIIGQYSSGLERLDMADCPADFRIAYRQHTRAWRDAQAAIQQLHDSFLERVFVGAMNTLLRGEPDGGINRLEGGLKRSLERVRMTWEEVEKIGAKYGAAL